MKQIDKIIKSQSEPKDTNVLWLDTSNPEEPILKEYDGGWKTVAGGGGGGGDATDAIKYTEQTLTESEQMQARKNQGLYYEEEGTEQMTLTWDGVTTGRDMIDWYGDTLYKIADFPDADAIINIAASTIMQNGTPYSQTYDPPFGVEDMSDLLVSGKYFAGGSFAFAKDAVLEQGGQAHTGVYFLKIDTQRMTIYPSSCTFNVKSSSVHQIPAKYIPSVGAPVVKMEVPSLGNMEFSNIGFIVLNQYVTSRQVEVSVDGKTIQSIEVLNFTDPTAPVADVSISDNIITINQGGIFVILVYLTDDKEYVGILFCNNYV